ncbi:hypothetical protein Tco_0964293, partial [Tanacetum coccineum]
ICLKMNDEEDEDNDEIKGLLLVYNHIANKREKSGHMESDIRTDVEYRKALLASPDVSALDKPHVKLENMLRRFIHELNPDDAGLDDGVTTSFQNHQTHYHMLILKLQRHTIDIISSRNQESSEHTKTKTFLNIQTTIRISREIISFQDDAKYKHVGPRHKVIQGCSRKNVLVFIKRRLKCRLLISSTSTTRKDLQISKLNTKSKYNDKGSRSKITKHEGTKSTTTKFKTKKLKFVCHWADPFKDLKWSNVPGVKLSSVSESDDTFSCLQALLDLNYLFDGFMDYLWSCELNISNFDPTDM